MSCNGWNHGPNCNCGWGGQWHGNIPAGGGAGTSFLPLTNSNNLRELARTYGLARRLDPRSDFRSITIPNASCPVCGKSVFFYQNAHGSRVFFDELGPPWPKHPCTDNGEWTRRSNHAIFSPAFTLQMHRADWLDTWTPFLIVDISGADVLLRKIFDDSEIWLLFDRPPPRCELRIAYCAAEKGALAWVVSILATDALKAQTFRATRSRLRMKSSLSGFRLYCEHERRLCRRIDAEREIAAIKSNKVSWRRHPWWSGRKQPGLLS